MSSPRTRGPITPVQVVLLGLCGSQAANRLTSAGAYGSPRSRGRPYEGPSPTAAKPDTIKAVSNHGFGMAIRQLSEGVVNRIAASHGATPPQVALAWLLAIADNMLLIPGTRTRGHLTENLAAGSLSLHDDDIASLNEASTTIY